jgi:serine protease Do
VAVIKINATGLNPVTFGTSSSMSVGDTIYTVGNPLGELTYTMTSGIVSALDRLIDTSESDSINMFQIDAAVNAGNSGGPVYNAAGKSSALSQPNTPVRALRALASPSPSTTFWISHHS